MPHHNAAKLVQMLTMTTVQFLQLDVRAHGSDANGLFILFAKEFIVLSKWQMLSGLSI